MSEHFENLIQRYYDGELGEKRRDALENHLVDCESCAGLLNEITQLSLLLQEETPTALKSNSAKFTSQVLLQLPVKNSEPWWRQVAKAAYAFIPALLFVSLLFIRVSTTTNILLTAAEAVGLGGEEVSSLIMDPLLADVVSPIDISGFELFDTGSFIWESFGSLNFFGIDIINAFVLPLLIGLLAVSWTIGWWVDQDKKQTLTLKV